MSSSMSLTDEESFNNYLDYKNDIEYDLSLKMSTDNLKYFDLAVLKELHTRNLVNYTFYKKQHETINIVHRYRRDHTHVSCLDYFLYTLILIIIGMVFILLAKGGFHINKNMDKFDI